MVKLNQDGFKQKVFLKAKRGAQSIGLLEIHLVQLGVKVTTLELKLIIRNKE